MSINFGLGRPNQPLKMMIAHKSSALTFNPQWLAYLSMVVLISSIVGFLILHNITCWDQHYNDIITRNSKIMAPNGIIDFCNWFTNAQTKHWYTFLAMMVKKVSRQSQAKRLVTAHPIHPFQFSEFKCHACALVHGKAWMFTRYRYTKACSLWCTSWYTDESTHCLSPAVQGTYKYIHFVTIISVHLCLTHVYMHSLCYEGVCCLTWFSIQVKVLP